MIKSVFAHKSDATNIRKSGFPFSLLGYVQSVLTDVRGTIHRALDNRVAFVVMALFLLPWLSLTLLRTDWSWLQSLGEIVAFTFLFWWMSRSGATPAATTRYPRLESVLTIALIALWLEWRIAICGNLLPFLPSDFSCFKNVSYEIAPKLFENVVVPAIILAALGYRSRGMSLQWSWRAWWIALPALLAAVAMGLYMHQEKPLAFAEGIGTFFGGAGLPEEFLFRALLLSRLEAWWKNPAWALFGAATIFGLSHLPINYLVFTRADWREAWITALTYQMGFGFAFGFAYQRIRSIWPIALLHAIVDAI